MWLTIPKLHVQKIKSVDFFYTDMKNFSGYPDYHSVLTRRLNAFMQTTEKQKNWSCGWIEPLYFQYFVKHDLTSSGNEQLKKNRNNLNNQDDVPDEILEI